MVINIHPIFVHFPIAMLTFYSLFELIKIKRINDQSWFVNTKFVLLTIGFFGSLAAIATGLLAKEAFVGKSLLKVVNVHLKFAVVTALFFGLIWIVYASHFSLRGVKNEKVQRVVFQINKLFPLIDKKALGIILSLIGLMLITITGALGGSIVYGTDTDPVVKLIYKILRLFINI